MATFPGFTNLGIPSDGNPGHFGPFGNVGAPYMATLSLPGLTVGLPVWLFSTSLVPAISSTGQSVPPPEQPHVESKVDPSPSSPVSTSSSSTSPSESPDSSNQVAKKKKKRTKKKKKKSPKEESKSAATTLSTPEVGPPSAPLWKVEFPCRLCKDDHLLRDCPGIPRVLEVWSHDPACPSSSYEAHGDATLSVGNGKKKGKIRFPCKLCEGNHPLHLCSLRDKASAFLESLIAPSPQLPDGDQHLSATIDRSPVDEEIALNPSLVQAPLPKLGCAKPVPDQPLVGQSVESSSPPVDHFVSEEHNSHVLLVSSDSPQCGNDSPTPATPENPALVPFEQGGNHTIPPPSRLVTSFDWSCFTYRIPSHVPFWVTVHTYNTVIPSMFLDEGASVGLMPATTWQALGSPPLVLVVSNLTTFDGGTSQPLGTLPKFPITLGGKTVYIDVSVTQGASKFNLLLGCEYVYAMGALVSSLFCVVRFPHNGRIVTINQLSFVPKQGPPAQSSSPPGFQPPVASAPSQINYVATYPMPGSSDAVVMHSVLGALDPDFQDIGLPSGVALLEASTSYSL